MKPRKIETMTPGKHLYEVLDWYRRIIGQTKGNIRCQKIKGERPGRWKKI